MKTITDNPLLIISSVFTTGAMSWKPGWLQKADPPMEGDASMFLEKARRQIESADTKEKVLDLINTYEQALKIDPQNREALMGAAWFNCLIALAYAENNDEGRNRFIKATTCCEQVMYLNPEFAKLADDGEAVWDASRVLSKTEIEALFLWYISASCCWKECLSGFTRLVNLKWLFRCKKVLEHLMHIDPSWGGGTPYYAWANFYAAVPRFAGGDTKKAAEYYKKAIELGPVMLNFRRTRAMLLHTKNKDRKGLEQDLNWVIAQDPKKRRHYFTYPYAVFVQREAREVLANIDDYL